MYPREVDLKVEERTSDANRWMASDFHANGHRDPSTAHCRRDGNSGRGFDGSE